MGNFVEIGMNIFVSFPFPCTDGNCRERKQNFLSHDKEKGEMEGGASRGKMMKENFV